jgi:hypothetical protein
MENTCSHLATPDGIVSATNFAKDFGIDKAERLPSPAETSKIGRVASGLVKLG